MEKILVKDIIENFFKTNPSTKDITEMTSEELQNVSRQIGMHAVNKIVDVIGTLTITDLYNIQSGVTKTSKAVEAPVAEVLEPVTAKPKAKRVSRPRVGGDRNFKFYSKRSSVPADVESSRVYLLANRKYGVKNNPLYGVIRNDIPLEQAKNILKCAYAKHIDTNYLNVTLRLADGSRRGRRAKADAKFYGNYGGSKN